MNASKKMCCGIVAAIAVASAGVLRTEAAAFEDECIEATDPAVRAVHLSDGIAYVFTNPAAGAVDVTFKVPATVTRTLVVAGGGGGGSPKGAGGGGGGVIPDSSIREVGQGDVVTLSVGLGGAANENGGNSSLTIGTDSTTAIGGGCGAAWGGSAGSGGSGGGGVMNNTPGGGGTANQGHAGGRANSNIGGGAAGGGGGATEDGQQYFAGYGARGGEGFLSNISGVDCVYGSGGGGGSCDTYPVAGKGGTNAGNGGDYTVTQKGDDGINGTGGGGGGASHNSSGTTRIGGRGGDGTVILRVTYAGYEGPSYYEDEVIKVADCSVRCIPGPAGLVYVFTNAAANEIFGSFKVPVVLEEALVVAGGGGGGGPLGSGGGGGGVILTQPSCELASNAAFSLRVGTGGEPNQNGGDSVLSVGGSANGFKAIGGGHGGAWGAGNGGATGGSGGGGVMNGTGGAGVPDQGSWGASSRNGCSAGGGGASEGGKVYGYLEGRGADGGAGLTCAITGTEGVYGSGGGGGTSSSNFNGPIPGVGGRNAGNGGALACPGDDAIDGFGGGGGGASHGNAACVGGRGGCGTIIVRVRPAEQGYLVFDPGLNPTDGTVKLLEWQLTTIGERVEKTETDSYDESIKVSTHCLGYVLERGNAQLGNWCDPETNFSCTASVTPMGTDALRVMWLKERSLGEFAAYRDRNVECSFASVRRKKIKRDNVSYYSYIFERPTVGQETILFKKSVELTRLLVVGGGGGGGSPKGAGGGGGGVRFSDSPKDILYGDVFRFAVGKGGAANENGGDTSLTIGADSMTAIGGGCGAAWNGSAGSGGSGGGGVMGANFGGAGTTGQGHAGGAANGDIGGAAGGGGGATEFGQKYVAGVGARGGEGFLSNISGVDCVYGSGGGGGSCDTYPVAGKGGTNAGNGGDYTLMQDGYDGIDGTGGGGGGASHVSGAARIGGKGGDGTVIVEVCCGVEPVMGLFLMVE